MHHLIDELDEANQTAREVLLSIDDKKAHVQVIALSRALSEIARGHGIDKEEIASILRFELMQASLAEKLR